MRDTGSEHVRVVFLDPLKCTWQMIQKQLLRILEQFQTISFQTVYIVEY